MTIDSPIRMRKWVSSFWCTGGRWAPRRDHRAPRAPRCPRPRWRGSSPRSIVLIPALRIAASSPRAWSDRSPPGACRSGRSRGHRSRPGSGLSPSTSSRIPSSRSGPSSRVRASCAVEPKRAALDARSRRADSNRGPLHYEGRTSEGHASTRGHGRARSRWKPRGSMGHAVDVRGRPCPHSCTRFVSASPSSLTPACQPRAGSRCSIGWHGGTSQINGSDSRLSCWSRFAPRRHLSVVSRPPR